MRILFLGDIVGKHARLAVIHAMPRLRDDLALDFVIVNGENAAGGFGITPDIAHAFLACGIDVITTGNHIWDKPEICGFIDDEPRLLRPCNFPEGTQGKGTGLFTCGDKRILVVNVMGQLFMDALDNPFVAVHRALEACPLRDMADAIVVDFHAEASSEKMAMGQFCDGRASLVIGTHTHIPTADTQILPEGTAYQSDAGMCGDYDSVIGMEKTAPVNRFFTKTHRQRLRIATGTPSLCGVVVETDDKTGLARFISPIRMGGRLSPLYPDFNA